jgi:hypothetical protein
MTSRRQAQQLHVGRCQDRLEVNGVQRVPVDDEMASVFQEAACRVGEVASDLRHPCPVGTVRDAGDVNATGLQVDDEEHEVANEPPPTVRTSTLKKSAAAIAPQ